MKTYKIQTEPVNRIAGKITVLFAIIMLVMALPTIENLFFVVSGFGTGISFLIASIITGKIVEQEP